MAVKTVQAEKNLIYFCTFTCYNWIPLFEKTNFYDAIYKWFDILLKKGNLVTGYVIMPNHFHGMIYISPESQTINKVMANAKRFFAYEIVKRLKELKEDKLLWVLRQGVPASQRKIGKLHQVFELSFDSKTCIYPHFTAQKLHYIHNNPLQDKWKLVKDPVDYPHSSARFYELGEHASYDKVVDYRDIEYRNGEIGGFW